MIKKWKYYEESKAIIDILNNYKSIVIYDVETSGLKKKTDKIIQFSAIRFSLPDWKEVNRLDIYIKCLFKINGSEASEKNGITDEMLEEKGIDEVEAFKLISEFISEKDLISGYNNQNFDDKMMAVFYKNHGLEFKFADNIDIIKFVRMIVPDEAVMIEEEKINSYGQKKVTKRPSYTLENVTSYYDPDNDTVFHSSINDVEATAFVFVMAMTEAQIMIEEYIKDEAKRKDIPRQIAKVIYINLYNPTRTMKRVYVKTDQGTIYYDDYKHEWSSKTGLIDSLDMDDIVKQVFTKLQINKESELFKAVEKKDKKEKAMKLLELKYNFSLQDLEDNYKNLIETYTSIENNEELLKEAKSAYSYLKKTII